MNIPFNKPAVDQSVLEEIGRVIASGKLGGDGPVCKQVEGRIRELFSVPHALLTTSCTHALEMAVMMLDLKHGDEVIIPSFTFVSTANAVLRAGGRPVFCEIEERTLTLDPAGLERLVNAHTRAVIPVHYAGVAARMDEVTSIARAHRFAVIEDAAQGVNARYRGRFLGTIGDAGAYSFHETKNYVSGEGGAFVTRDEELARKAEIIREKGTNRSNFLRGEVDKYTWVQQGSSYILSDILAAVLKCQLADLAIIQKSRQHIHERYLDGLRPLEDKGLLRLPEIPEDCQSNYHIFYVLLRSESERTRVMAQLKAEGIGTTFHYVPLHSSPYAVQNLGTGGTALPVTDRVAGTLLRLPIYPQLTGAEIDYIIERLTRALTAG